MIEQVIEFMKFKIISKDESMHLQIFFKEFGILYLSSDEE